MSCSWIKILKKIGALRTGMIYTLNYDNTYIFSGKADTRNTYLKQYPYAPGLGLLENKWFTWKIEMEMWIRTGRSQKLRLYGKLQKSICQFALKLSDLRI